MKSLLRMWLVLTISALALTALGNSADASRPASTLPTGFGFGTQASQAGAKDEPFDCSQIEAKGIHKQTNVRHPEGTWQIMQQCGKAGSSPEPSSPATNVGGSITNKPFAPLTLGGTDADIILPEGTYPNVSQSTTVSWAHGNVIITEYDDTKNANACFADYSYSTDGGTSWTAAGGASGSNDLCAGHGTNYGEPIVVYNAWRDLWFLGDLASGCGMGIGLWTTTDANPGTLRAGECAVRNINADKPSIWVDNNPSSPWYGRMYISFNNFSVGGGAVQVIYSEDGITWSPPVTVNPNFVRNVQITGDLGGNGNLYLVAQDEGGGQFRNRTNLIYRSTDGGRTWSSAISMGASFPAPGRSLCWQNNYWPCMFGTGTWEYMGYGQAAAVDKTVGYVYTKCGGRSAVPCPESEDKGDVYFVGSTDAGLTWGTPVRLNTDTGSATQWQPSLAATVSGSLLASWYDSREVNLGRDFDCPPGSATQMCYRRWGRLSFNGGASWQKDDRIGDALSPLPTRASNSNFAGYYNASTCDTTRGYTSNCYDQWVDGRVIVNGVSQQDVFLDMITLP